MRLFGEFVGKQVLCSLFPLYIFAAAALTYQWHAVPRYDALLLLCLLAQLVLVKSGLETVGELKMICAYHAAGLLLELYKVSHGSWTYPAFSYTKIGGVPLFSGFMYASIASYMIQAWRRFDLRFTGMPKWPWLALVGAAIYLNFFSGRLIGDQRHWIAPAVLLLFWKCTVHFRPSFRPEGPVWRMPMAAAFGAIGFFVWMAEQLCTGLGVWQYPHQVVGWQPVHLAKWGSWSLLVVISFLLVALTKRASLQPTSSPQPQPAAQ